MGGTMGGTLTLGGMISGSSTLEIAAPGCDTPNFVALTSACSTFCGGVTVDGAYTTLAVGNSSQGGVDFLVTAGPLGTGTLTLKNGSNFTTVGSSDIWIGNSIVLCDSNDGCNTVTLMGGTMGGNLTLGGMISGSSTLEIASSGCVTGNFVALTSACSTFCGGVTVDAGNTTLSVGNSSQGGVDSLVTAGPLGTGTLTLKNGSNF